MIAINNQGADMKPRLNLAGMQIGRWSVIEYVGGSKWLCQCSCGTSRHVFTANLRNCSRSCGCLKAELQRGRGHLLRRPPIYTLPHGIEVIGEYAPRGKNLYWRVRLRPHRFFPGVKEHSGAIHVRRCRVVIASKLGRPIAVHEHVHHIDEDRENDAPENLVLLSRQEHNSHHKTGSTHSEQVKARIAESLRRAYREQRHARFPITNRDHLGRIGRSETP